MFSFLRQNQQTILLTKSTLSKISTMRRHKTIRNCCEKRQNVFSAKLFRRHKMNRQLNLNSIESLFYYNTMEHLLCSKLILKHSYFILFNKYSQHSFAVLCCKYNGIKNYVGDNVNISEYSDYSDYTLNTMQLQWLFVFFFWFKKSGSTIDHFIQCLASFYTKFSLLVFNKKKTKTKW